MRLFICDKLAYTKAKYFKACLCGYFKGDGYGWDLLRVIPSAIITGQAAGAASSIAIDDNKAVHDIDIIKLQEILSSQNVMIHFDDSLVDRKMGPEEDADFEKYDHI